MLKQCIAAGACLLVIAAQSSGADSSGNNPTITRCMITALQKQAVPASDSGVLTSLRVKLGQHVTTGMELAEVDANEARAVVEVKQAERDVAEQKAKSDIEIRHAEAGRDVARENYYKYRQANAGVVNAIADIEVKKAKFEWERSELSIDKAKEEAISNKLTLKAKNAEVGAAEVNLRRRTLKAPYDAVVSVIYKQAGEWLSPGDAVLELVRIDRLKIAGDLDANTWSPVEVENRRVTIDVELAGGKRVPLEGKVVFVSPTVISGKFRVEAEFDAPLVEGRPLVRDGMVAQFTVLVKPSLNAGGESVGPPVAGRSR